MATLLTSPSLPTHEQLQFAPDESIADQVSHISQGWLTRLELACASNDPEAFAALFSENAVWRDILAFTNEYRSITRDNIPIAAKAVLPPTGAHKFIYAATPPSLSSPFPDVTFIEIHFDFETQLGPAFGIAKLVKDGRKGPDADWAAYMLFTILDGIHGHPEQVGANRPRGTHNSQESWSNERKEFVEFDKETQPSVLILGGGHNGLSVAARLKALGTESLVIDRQKRTGDNWRLRYKSLSLHDPVYANHLAYFPFPANWPVFTPAGKLANWLETYADVLELNVWNESELIPSETKYNESAANWDVTILRTVDGKQVKRKFTLSHIVLATGLGGGKAKFPAKVEGQDSFGGQIVHSSQHGTGKDQAGKKALVVGACTSAHDISLDLLNGGAQTTMLQRSPTYVMSVAKGMPMMLGSLFSENGPNLELADKIAESTPKHIVKLFHQRIIPQLAEQDKDLLAGLKKAGFKTTLGPDNSGFIMMALERAGGYFFNQGTSERIIDGSIKVRQGEIARFKGNGSKTVVFKDGSEEDFDYLVYATGYTGFDQKIAETVGPQYVAQMSQIWSLDEEGELKGAYRDSKIPKFYVMVGNLSAARLNSKSVALQIKAEQLGKFGKRYTYADMLAAKGALA